MKRIERIEHYEALLDQIAEANRRLEEALDGFRRAEAAAAELGRYYGSNEWKRDLAADEAGKLPSSLKRGVLSEDGAYDALEENRRLRSLLNEEALAG